MTSFKICTYDFAYPDADNSDDADWHRNYLTFTAPGFKAEVDEVILEGTIIQYYLGELRSFSSLEKDEVIFEPTEPYFELTIRFLSKKKDVGIEGYVQSPVGTGPKLEFDFETDLTFVDEFIEGLELILAGFPAVRKR
ncbi:WapI family immunity protein [Bacillus marinisedimentorum]|uniref:WapI family immunity protein n=1 Tax=Bacillus marinisedimentorum TaxID=1821260 RepID=UPI000826AFF2|nr:hypothetical protein [Bacillus marinisedimentorum]